MSRIPMVAGTCIAGRFLIEQTARSGGTSTVFQAYDLQSKQRVALKLLHPGTPSQQVALRLALEAQLLARLEHPGIVKYLLQGRTPSGQPFLVMEWLDGEDLYHRLRRQPLSLHESLVLVQQVAAALAVAHKQGIVHRDIKPSNLFLRSGLIKNVTLVDFGIARDTLVSQSLTQPGTVIGTPEYMAPEQARGQRDVTASADIFSLGCVLFECIAGHAPLWGMRLAAQLAKVLLEEAPRLRSLQPAVPEPLDALVARMLEKDPTRRPQNGTALLAELRGLEALGRTTAPPLATPRRESLPIGEQQLLCAIMASTASPLPTPADTLSAGPEEPARSPRVELLHVLTRFGGRIEWLADGSLIVLLSQQSTATDQALQAARCALGIKKLWPEALVALATGRALVDGPTPMGEVIDQVVNFLHAHLAVSLATPTAALPGVLLDEVTAGLIETKFVVTRVRAGLYLLQGARAPHDEVRQLLGAALSCAGRESELLLLHAMLRECSEESIARAILVIADPGVGKSRLRQEFIRALAEQHPEQLVLIGRGELVSSDAPYSIIGNAVRQLCGIFEDDSRLTGRAKLREQLSRRLPIAQHSVTFELMAELCGLGAAAAAATVGGAMPPPPDETQVGQAFLRFLTAECEAHPVLLVLDDLQWSDALSVQLIDRALGELAEQPLMVLALSRPEISRLFPKMWCEHRLQELRLDGLSPQACIRLIGEVLGPDLPAPRVARIVELARGNALYLEELMRAVADGKGNEVPETLLAIIQGRLMHLPAAARRVLCAASVFGQRFWEQGVRALLGGAEPLDYLGPALQILLDEGIIIRQQHSRFADTAEYRFRLTLKQEAAYSLLTAAERQIGHRLAYRYLLTVGEPSAAILAEHAEHAGAQGAARGSSVLDAAP